MIYEDENIVNINNLIQKNKKNGYTRISSKKYFQILG